MADENLIDRLKRLQEQLLAIYAETLALRAEAERKAKERNLSEWPDFHLTQPDTR
jgi:hypothetical protein